MARTKTDHGQPAAAAPADEIDLDFEIVTEPDLLAGPRISASSHLPERRDRRREDLQTENARRLRAARDAMEKGKTAAGEPGDDDLITTLYRQF